jgi:hypothetical protein
MFQLIGTIIKLSFLAVVMLLVSQVPVNGKRIADHVQEFTRSKTVQRPIEWISNRVDLTGISAPIPVKETKARNKTSSHAVRHSMNKPVAQPHAQAQPQPQPETEFEHSKTDAEQLSGVLKGLSN